MATHAHMSHEVVPDALPYVDQGYDEPGVRDMVNELIEEEVKRYRPTKNYLEFMPTPNYSLFETKLMKQEFDRISNRQPMELLSMKRYELPQPAAAQKTDLSAWSECLKNSMAQLEHQAERVANLELLSQYGANSWRCHCDVLQRMFEAQQRKHAEIKRHIQEINWDRKTVQKKAGSELQRLEESWIGLVSKNYEIERAIVETESEVEALRQEVQ
ncbi:pre-mRNA-splicing factor SPF27-like [Hydractinia symbiolongicarpus]|uniref:pre-mRNA-splicing factor SPF27-like n=1 Tax=Hydractinia symbiolongicarpus TaxID=13093 RepID=UPI0025506D46|nr:pre-mRNA-splicing factor SPF27-like [Hydractinia symbiolongicarpus]